MDSKNNKGCKEIFAERLKKLRSESGLSQEKLARELGISKGSLGFYETYKNTPDIEVLNSVAKYFNVSTNYLLGISENKTTNAELQDVCDYTGLSENAIEYIKSINERERYILNLLFKTNEMKEIVNSIRICATCHFLKINLAGFLKNCETMGDDTDKYKKLIIELETNIREYKFHIDYDMQKMFDTILKDNARKELALSNEAYEELLGLAEAIVKENDKALGHITLDDLKLDW